MNVRELELLVVPSSMLSVDVHLCLVVRCVNDATDQLDNVVVEQVDYSAGELLFVNMVRDKAIAVNGGQEQSRY